MVIDKLENLEKYVSLNPLFAQAVEFLKTTDLNAHEIGKVVLKEGELIVNFAQARPKTKEEAKLETHNNFIDIQIPLSGVETMGYTPRTDLPEEEYNAEKDIQFWQGRLSDYSTGYVCHILSTRRTRSWRNSRRREKSHSKSSGILI